MSPKKYSGPLGKGQWPRGMKHLEGFPGFSAIFLLILQLLLHVVSLVSSLCL